MLSFPIIPSINYIFLVICDIIVMLINFAAGWPSIKKEKNPGPDTNFYGKKSIIFISTKVALVPLIYLFLIKNLILSEQENQLQIKVFSYFLLASWFGDIFLLIRNYFAKCFGVASFSLAHALLAFYNYLICQIDPRDCSKNVFTISTPMGILIFIIMFPKIFKSKLIYWPIAGYALILFLSGIICSIRIDLYSYNDPKFFFYYLGILSFTISDTVLITQEIDEKSMINNFIILLTYGSAMLLLTIGFLADQNL